MSIAIVDGDPVLGVERWTLPSGLDVVVHADDATPLCAVSVWYRAGSSDEVTGRTGLAHLFEHLFKNSAHLEGRHHYEVLRRAGAVDANASTSADRTAYHEVVPSHQLDLALWIESDRMGYLVPGLTEARVAAQQAVVINERRQRYENVAYGADRLAVAEALYPAGHPHRHLTIGLTEDIAAATRDDVVAWYRTWYVPANATLVISGDVDVDDARARIDRWFGSFPASTRPVRARVPAPRRDAPARVAVDDRFAALRRLHRAWITPAAFAPGDAELDVLAGVLASPGTGALWRALVYDRPWAQRVQVWQAGQRLGGELHVVVDLRTEADADAARAVMDDVLAAAREGTLPGLDRAVERVKTRRDAALLWRLEGVARRAALLQRYVLYLDDPGGLARELARYRSVSVGGVVAAAREHLQPHAMVEVETRPVARA